MRRVLEVDGGGGISFRNRGLIWNPAHLLNNHYDPMFATSVVFVEAHPGIFHNPKPEAVQEGFALAPAPTVQCMKHTLLHMKPSLVTGTKLVIVKFRNEPHRFVPRWMLSLGIDSYRAQRSCDRSM